MKKHGVGRTALCAMGPLLICFAAGLSTAEAGLLPPRVEQAARDRIAAGMNQTIVFGIVDGDKVDFESFGKLDNGTTPDADSVYEIGSITKTFTATMLAQDVLAGQVTLDTPVGQLLPDFKIPERNGKKITLGLLAMQVSGLPRMPTNFTPADPGNPFADYDTAKLKAFLGGYTLTRDPGASYEYSNVGEGLLGYALAQAQHTTYAGLVTERILQPLGMAMSGISFTDAMRAHLAPGHDPDGKPAENWDLTDALVGAGGIRSTAHDMMRYLKANMGLDQTPLLPAMKFAQDPRRDVMPKERIGLVWMTTDHGVTWHNGGTGGYRSFLGFAADRQHGVIVLTNTSAGVDDLGMATLVADAPLQVVHKEIVLPSLAAYVGTYQLAPTVQFKVTLGGKGDTLFGQMTGQDDIFKLHPWAENEFFLKEVAANVSFTRDAKGAVTAVVLHQNGTDRTAPKVGN